jgi:hypothetical protein
MKFHSTTRKLERFDSRCPFNSERNIVMLLENISVGSRKKLKNLFDAPEPSFLTLVRDKVLVPVKRMSVAAFLTVLETS